MCEYCIRLKTNLFHRHFPNSSREVKSLAEDGEIESEDSANVAPPPTDSVRESSRDSSLVTVESSDESATIKHRKRKKSRKFRKVGETHDGDVFRYESNAIFRIKSRKTSNYRVPQRPFVELPPNNGDDIDDDGILMRGASPPPEPTPHTEQWPSPPNDDDSYEFNGETERSQRKICFSVKAKRRHQQYSDDVRICCARILAH